MTWLEELLRPFLREVSYLWTFGELVILVIPLFIIEILLVAGLVLAYKKLRDMGSISEGGKILVRMMIGLTVPFIMDKCPSATILAG